jgi:hypothetical protein
MRSLFRVPSIAYGVLPHGTPSERTGLVGARARSFVNGLQSKFESEAKNRIAATFEPVTGSGGSGNDSSGRG